MDKLEINLLGTYRISCGERSIGPNQSGGNARKMWLLFGYLLMNRDRAVPQEELIHLLWDGKNVADPQNSLKVLVFKLRKEIDSLGAVPGKELIRNIHGAYKFNSSTEFFVDLFEFEKLVRSAEEFGRSQDERLDILRRAIDVYKGDPVVLSRENGELSAARQRAMNYYRGAVAGIQEILSEKEDYQGIVNLCNEALRKQPSEASYYYYLITAYAAMEDYESASRMYDRVKDILQKERGTDAGMQFESAYREMMKARLNRNMSLDELAEDLDEKMDYVSSFYVEYGEFKQIYHLIARQMGRYFQNARICLYSLGVRRGVRATRKEKEENMKVLENALAFTLRQSDIFSRSGPTQFAVLLVQVSEADSGKIADRIKAYFDRHKKNPNFGIIYSMAIVETPQVRR